jgi:hypothetical protein
MNDLHNRTVPEHTKIENAVTRRRCGGPNGQVLRANGGMIGRSGSRRDVPSHRSGRPPDRARQLMGIEPGQSPGSHRKDRRNDPNYRLDRIRSDWKTAVPHHQRCL